jgi:hypothetical protein
VADGANIACGCCGVMENIDDLLRRLRPVLIEAVVSGGASGLDVHRGPGDSAIKIGLTCGGVRVRMIAGGWAERLGVAPVAMFYTEAPRG